MFLREMVNKLSRLRASKWLSIFLTAQIVVASALPGMLLADVIGGVIGGVGGGTGELIECRNGCESTRDQCLQGVMDRFAAAHAACEIISGDDSYPYGDSYYSCMAALGFGNPADPTNPLGPLESIAEQRQDCRDQCEECKAGCNRRFGVRVIRGVFGID